MPDIEITAFSIISFGMQASLKNGSSFFQLLKQCRLSLDLTNSATEPYRSLNGNLRKEYVFHRVFSSEVLACGVIIEG